MSAAAPTETAPAASAPASGTPIVASDGLAPPVPSPRAAPSATLADVGAGLAMLLAIRFIVPRLLRRL
ncbi:MAG TPA: hypothetical protein VF524_05930 [Polyangia bacterium]